MTRTLTAIAIAAAAGTAFAQETFVVPDDFPTLQQVLDPNVSGIDPGDIVVLRDSVSYVGTFDVLVADLTIRAAEGDTPVLDANGAGTVITVNIANSNLTLEGLTIEDGGRVGNNDRGTGIDIANAGTVTIRDCVIRNNASKNGGGLFARNTDVVVEDSIFQNNSAPNGGGMFVDGASDVTIRNTTFLGNAATSGIGGGIEIQVTTANAITIEGSTFTGNSCTAHGGAADLQDAGFVTITDTVFTGNTATQSADDDGGALFIDRIEHLTSIRGCIFDSNLANGNGAAVNSVLGNGRRCEYVDTRFIGNEASGSAIAAAGGTIDFFNCEFIANTSLRAGNENGDGGAIRFVRFDDRTRAFGRVFNTIFDGNIGNLGGAVVIGRGSTVDILNSTFVNNEANVNGAAISVNSGDANVQVFNNIFADNAPREDQVNIAVANGVENASFNLFDSDGLTGAGENNILGADPMFANAAAGDYALLAGSLAIDAGNSDLYVGGPFADFGGKLRGQDDPATADTGVSRIGAVIDMGAFEFNVEVVNECPADFAAPFGRLDLADVVGFLQLFEAGCP